MKVKMIKNLPRLCTIQDELKPEDYRKLKEGKTADIKVATAEFLISKGFLMAVEEKKKEVKEEIVDNTKKEGEI